MGLRIGEISYTNILPLFFYLNRERLAANNVSFVPQIPTELNRKMEQGLIDLGGISSFSYGENSDRYSLLPNLSVSSFGKVRSIFLFSKKPIDMLAGDTIALTSSSATSVNLLKIILADFYKIDVDYHMMKPNYGWMMENYNACLLIGDDAIKAAWNEKKSSVYTYDLGAEWYKFTGLPMTFAVMAVRNEVIERQKALLLELLSEMQESKELNRQNQYSEMIPLIIQQHGGDFHYWSSYFKGLNYDFNEEHQKGLQYYYELAQKSKLLNKKPQIKFIDYSLQGI
ncbi:menaquinone biosynthesis protein [Fictibacillus sp. Mic-4]|uniref:menaquinone biosynthetic enzyme MqnA/MqnD family protein n=1 Tax=Fictibacillus sp. Mic-4 TaxID=3132826 RepID=UPI003CF08D98